MKNKENKCIFPDCKNKNNGSRGLCIPHYGLLLKATVNKQKTWEDFEKAGWCTRGNHRGKRTALSEEFYKRLKKM